MGDNPDSDGLDYRKAGVDIDAGQEAVRLIRPLAEATMDSRVLTDIGGFSGLYGLGSLCLEDPVLVASTDGVGTKLKVAIMAGKHDTVGQDLVAMSVNDILAQGARPLFFLDYVAMSKLEPEKVRDIVSGIAHGCRLAGCALLGGETAEMPGFYGPGDYDLAGFAVGVVERRSIIDGSRIALGHRLIGLGSSGLHSNGYSLARKVVFDLMGLKADSPLLDGTVADILLRPTRIYVKSVLAAARAFPVHGVAHITGGGILDNLPRILPQGCRAVLDPAAWPLDPIFGLLREAGGIKARELYRTFNMGLGLILAVPPGQADEVLAVLEDHGEKAYMVGQVEIASRGPRVVLEGLGDLS
jgi:phosphoribosylformylglycinamidine cyclo-ligase